MVDEKMCMTPISSVGALAVGALMFCVVSLTGRGNENSTESSATRFERLCSQFCKGGEELADITCTKAHGSDCLAVVEDKADLAQKTAGVGIAAGSVQGQAPTVSESAQAFENEGCGMSSMSTGSAYYCKSSLSTFEASFDEPLDGLNQR